MVWGIEVTATQAVKVQAINKLVKLASLEGALKLSPMEGKNREDKRAIKAFLKDTKLECLMLNSSDKTFVGLDAMGTAVKVALLNNTYILA